MSSNNKSWFRGSVSRKVWNKSPKLIYLYCEGQTEYYYFVSLTKGNSRIKIIPAYIWATPWCLVREAINAIKNQNIELNWKDEVWCIFDKDNHADIADAFIEFKRHNKRAIRSGGTILRIAYSNESFEYWCLLHFDYVDTAITRHLLNSKLWDKINTHHYGSSGKWDKELLEKILSNNWNLEIACENAMKIYNSHWYPETLEEDYIWDTLNFQHQPNTTVHFLVEAIRKVK